MTRTLSETLRVGPERVTIRDDDSGATPGFEGGKKAAASALAKLAKPVSDLQERLYAESRVDGRRSILLLLQGMDTSGKGGVVRHCGGLLDPQGVRVTAFKAPTEEERRHDFLWRVEPHSPEAGMIAIFDRSHYEDVLIARVRRLADESEIDRRYGAINDFERRLTDAGTTVVKCFLHISYAKQGERLRKRLDNPAKHWKFNPGDVDERRLWPDYHETYKIALERCTTSYAPWFVVPSDHKWYRNWAITTLLHEHLAALDPQWPKTSLDIDEQKARLAQS
jgi:PPK2 family polyphosphate:nucleotide phosphotransferase